MSNKLKFGQRVIAWNQDIEEAEKGRFILNDGEPICQFHVLPDGDKEVDYFNYCQLDPDATEFLRRDKVEVEGHGICSYAYRVSPNRHVLFDKNGREISCSINEARYPKPEKSFKERLNEAIEGGAKVILLNGSMPLHGIDKSVSPKENVAYSYKGIPVCITYEVDEFEVLK